MRRCQKDIVAKNNLTNVDSWARKRIGGQKATHLQTSFLSHSMNSGSPRPSPPASARSHSLDPSNNSSSASLGRRNASDGTEADMIFLGSKVVTLRQPYPEQTDWTKRSARSAQAAAMDATHSSHIAPCAASCDRYLKVSLLPSLRAHRVLYTICGNDCHHAR